MNPEWEKMLASSGISEDLVAKNAKKINQIMAFHEGMIAGDIKTKPNFTVFEWVYIL